MHYNYESETSKRDQKANSDADCKIPCPGVQAPSSVGLESIDKGSRPAPYNPGSTPNGPQGGKPSL